MADLVGHIARHGSALAILVLTGFHYTEFDYAAPFTGSLDDDEAAKGVDSKTGQAILLKPVAEFDPDAS